MAARHWMSSMPTWLRSLSREQKVSFADFSSSSAGSMGSSGAPAGGIVVPAARDRYVSYIHQVHQTSEHSTFWISGLLAKKLKLPPDFVDIHVARPALIVPICVAILTEGHCQRCRVRFAATRKTVGVANNSSGSADRGSRRAVP